MVGPDIHLIDIRDRTLYNRLRLKAGLVHQTKGRQLDMNCLRTPSTGSVDWVQMSRGQPSKGLSLAA